LNQQTSLKKSKLLSPVEILLVGVGVAGQTKM